MSAEQTRRERFIQYAAQLRERFESGMLSELQPLNQWVVWRNELEGGKKKKVPYNPNHFNARASVKIPKSWGTLDESLKALETGNYSGLGFMITPPLVFFDLDHCYDKATKTITDPQAQAIEQALNEHEHSNKFGKAVFYDHNHEFQQETREEQLIAEGCKRLIENVIILWNYLYLSEKLAETSEGTQRDELLEQMRRSSILNLAAYQLTWRI